jgi:hypothetical protein
MMNKSVRLVILVSVVCLQTISIYAQEVNDIQKSTKKRIKDSLYPRLVESVPPMNINLLAGYKNTSATDFEGNDIGQIIGFGGVQIKYEIGRSQGLAVDIHQKRKYFWYREQLVQGYKVRIALNKKKTLIVSIQLDEKSHWYAANFYGKIRKNSDISDMLLMILSLHKV